MLDMKTKVALFDTQTSNIKSVYYALLKVGFEVKIVKNSSDFKNIYDGFVFPGIGSFRTVMKNLKKKNLDNIIMDQINLIPSLFICVGMQILFDSSEEFGFTEGLGIIKGSVKKLPNKYEKSEIKVPAIGWNNVVSQNKINNKFSIIQKNLVKPYYFTHSFYCNPNDKNIISSSAKIKNFEYCSSVSFNKINALQFHPEKSGEYGLKLYKNFFNICKN